MGRKPLGVSRHNMNLDDDDLARVKALVGDKGVSKFVREAIREKLDTIAPGDENDAPPFLEYAGRHEPRLTASGRSLLLGKIRREKSLDKMMAALGYTDPIEFLHALMGYSALPNRAVSALVAQVLPNV